MKVIRVSNTNLFRVALEQLGDATQWTRLAQLNRLWDPIITDPVDLLVPNTDPTAPKGLPK